MELFLAFLAQHDDEEKRVVSQPKNEQVVLGRYRVVRRLTQGGMGVVYLAEQLRLKRQVALTGLRRRPEQRDLRPCARVGRGTPPAAASLPAGFP